jgi:hypothetical protein
MDIVGGKYSYRLSQKIKRSDCKMNRSLEDTIWPPETSGSYGDITESGNILSCDSVTWDR